MNYDNTDTGVLFKNDRKENDKQPDYTGNIHDAQGNKRRLAAWIKEGKSGKFMSLRVSDFQESEAKGGNVGGDEPDDDLPF